MSSSTLTLEELVKLGMAVAGIIILILLSVKLFGLFNPTSVDIEGARLFLNSLEATLQEMESEKIQEILLTGLDGWTLISRGDQTCLCSNLITEGGDPVRNCGGDSVCMKLNITSLETCTTPFEYIAGCLELSGDVRNIFILRRGKNYVVSQFTDNLQNLPLNMGEHMDNNVIVSDERVRTLVGQYYFENDVTKKAEKEQELIDLINSFEITKDLEGKEVWDLAMWTASSSKSYLYSEKTPKGCLFHQDERVGSQSIRSEEGAHLNYEIEFGYWNCPREMVLYGLKTPLMEYYALEDVTEKEAKEQEIIDLINSYQVIQELEDNTVWCTEVRPIGMELGTGKRVYSEKIPSGCNFQINGHFKRLRPEYGEDYKFDLDILLGQIDCD